jgi:hypothetical protein
MQVSEKQPNPGEPEGSEGERLHSVQRLQTATVRRARTPLFNVHDTEDGMIYSRATREGRKWIARHWGPQLDGMRVCRTMREANAYLEESFSEMFPEHRCTERCQLMPNAPDPFNAHVTC